MLELKSKGHDVRVVDSPLDAVNLFEPLDLLEGVLRTVQPLEDGRGDVENTYARAVRPEGNPESRRLIAEVFEVCDRKWRGIGSIPSSGYALRPEYHDHDVEPLFAVEGIATQESAIGISGQILKGLKNRTTARPSARPVPRKRR